MRKTKHHDIDELLVACRWDEVKAIAPESIDELLYDGISLGALLRTKTQTFDAEA